MVRDLDGDGQNEIIIATESKLMVLESTKGGRKENGEAERLPVKVETPLRRASSSVVGRRPVLVETGYLEGKQEGKIRQQVIVVLTDGFVLLCFDHKLELLWESTVVEVPAELYFREAAIFIHPSRMNLHDKGVVVVATNLAVKSVSEHFADENNLSKYELLKRAQYLLKIEKENERVNELVDHFSYHAFDGKTGGLRWKHERGDFLTSPLRAALREEVKEKRGKEEGGERSEERLKESLLNYKQHVVNNMEGLHFGEHEWKVFKEDIILQLPLFWNNRDDTLLYSAHFERRKETGVTPNKKSPWSASSLGLPKKLQSFHSLSQRWHSPYPPNDKVLQDKEEKPNVLVAKNSGGVEVVHLYTGRPLCHLPLPTKEGKVSYDDINHDNVIDQILLLSKNNKFCSVKILSGFPSMSEIFHFTHICSPSSLLASLFSTKQPGELEKGEEEEGSLVDAVTPLSLSFQDSSTLIFFFVSKGVVSCVDEGGRQVWSVQTNSNWKLSSPFVESELASLSSFRLSHSLLQDHTLLLALGSSHLSVLHAREGTLLAEEELSFPPILKPTIGDWNNDGINDLIISTPYSFEGFSLQVVQSTSLFPLLIALFLSFSVISLLFSHQSKKLN